MTEIPDFVRMEDYVERANGTYTRYSTPELNLRIRQMIEMLGLDPKDGEMKKKIWSDRTQERIISHLLSYAIQEKKVDYTHTWYKWLKNKINEFHYRYTKHQLIHKDTIDAYKKLFRLYLFITTETGVLKAEDKGKELNYYIAAQYSARYSPVKGLLTKFTVDTFLFNRNILYYRDFKKNGFPPTLIIPGPKLLYHPKETNEHKRRLRNLPDIKCTPFLDITLPILNLRIPALTRKTNDWLHHYLRSIELMMIRERLLARPYNRFLLSVEHLRVYKEIMSRASTK